MKVNMISKKILMVSAFLLMLVGTALPTMAQSTPVKKDTIFYHGSITEIKVGDSIYVHQDSLYYLTGERISKWVYKVPHYVQQVSGRRYPHGVLIGGIYSWVYPATLISIKPVVPISSLQELAEKNQDTVPTGPRDTTIIDFREDGRIFEYVYDEDGVLISEEDITETCWRTITFVNYDDSVLMTAQVKCNDMPLYTAATPARAQTTAADGKQYRYTFRGWSPELTKVRAHATYVAVYDSTEVITLTEAVNPGTNIPVSLQIDRFSIGVRGGFASTLAKVDQLPLGYNLALDLRYAHYWAGDENMSRIGIMTGLDLNYMFNAQSATINEAYTLPTDEGNVDYTVTVDKVIEKTHHLQLQVPVMFSLITPGNFFLNVGPKFIIPVRSTYQLKLNNPVISAYMPELNGRPLVNNIVMGQVKEEDLNKKDRFNKEFKMAITLAAELGYEFKFKNKNSLSLGGYIDYSVISAYQNEGTGSVITITPPSANGIADVKVQSLTSAYSSKFGIFDLGLKVAYNLNFEK